MVYKLRMTLDKLQEGRFIIQLVIVSLSVVVWQVDTSKPK
jgi:hypothetical protein